jgi:hypothetical protein
MNLMMTSWVQQGQIIYRVCAAINQPNHCYRKLTDDLVEIDGEVYKIN